jgi:hypothetical protein
VLLNLAVGSSKAIPLTAGNTILALPGIDPFGATAIADITVPFSTASFSGTLRTRVWTGDVFNLLGGLTFTYELTNSGGSLSDITRIAIGNFGSLGTDADWSIWLPGKAATTIDRTSDGDVVGFNFLPPLFGFLGPGTLGPGQTSRPLVIKTNATSFAPSLAAISSGGVLSNTTTAATFAPLAIPEPSTLLLAGVGAIGAAFAARRMRKPLR